MNHDELRELLPLAASGVLNEEEAAAVRRHTSECAACAQELERWRIVTTHLTDRPCPPVPSWLAQRTVQRVKQRHETAEEHRLNHLVLAFLIVFSWMMSLATWSFVHLIAGISLLPWLALSMLLSWITAGSAAVILGSHSTIRERNI